MSMHTLTTQEKLSIVESVIREYELGIGIDRGNRAAVMKSLAADLRARLDGVPTVTLVQLEQRVAAVKRSQNKLGYSVGSMVSLAEQVLGAWPVIKQSVERFGAEVENV